MLFLLLRFIYLIRLWQQVAHRIYKKHQIGAPSTEIANVSKYMSELLYQIAVYIPGDGVETPQFCSSDMSPQSLSPSQIQRAGMQRPVLAHWNWFGPQVGPAVDKYNTYNSLHFDFARCWNRIHVYFFQYVTQHSGRSVRCSSEYSLHTVP